MGRSGPSRSLGQFGPIGLLALIGRARLGFGGDQGVDVSDLKECGIIVESAMRARVSALARVEREKTQPHVRGPAASLGARH
jgi:hypothetical protein